MPADAPYAYMPLAVLDTADDDVLLADTHGPVIVARWAPISALARAIASDVMVSPSPGAPGDESLRLLPGLRIDGDGAWLPVGDVEGISMRGFVPATSTGVSWEEATPLGLRTAPARAPIELHRASTEASPIVAVISAGVQIAVRPERGWQVVTASTRHAIAIGYALDVQRDAEDERPRMHADTTYPVGSCLYDAPGGAAVGVVNGYVDAPPMPSDEPGWFTLDIATAFGRQKLFTDRIAWPRLAPD